MFMVWHDEAARQGLVHPLLKLRIIDRNSIALEGYMPCKTGELAISITEIVVSDRIAAISDIPVIDALTTSATCDIG